MTVEKARQLFSRITFLITIVMGAVTTMTIIEEPESFVVQRAERTVAGGRTIASVDGVGAIRSAPQYMQTVDVKCGDEDSVTTSSMHVRIKGQSCKLKTGELAQSKITNSTNGFVATVFYQGSLDFTTDYITLAEGENTIEIEHFFKTGESESRKVVIRRE